MSILEGMKTIAAHVNRCESTMLYLIRDCAFPARKIGGTWVSDTEVIKSWRALYIAGAKVDEIKRKLAAEMLLTEGMRKAISPPTH